MNKLLIVCGPTATGKTTLAVQLAKKFNGELVSADSRQIYKEMDIGTGKDIFRRSKIKDKRLKIKIKNQIYELIPYDMDGIPLWLYDVVNPDEEFSVAHYQHIATSVIENIRKRGKLPIVVGGTGLYIKSLLFPIETSHIPPNKQLRKTLERYSLEDLQKRLQKEDSLTWDLMNLSDRQNPRRLIRKIEIALYKKDRKTSDNKTSLHQCFGGQAVRAKKIEEDILLIGLTASYPVLYQRIDERVEKRVRQGIVGEVKSLLGKGYSWDLPSMNTFGYKEWKLA
ncbi:tRNA (adenosine(37)-N6)-dimethylallyltransferase MiaA, partial [Patescibacteria group bacterium]|nr:tRNA (adenosine(37)-N6)-dimethylallyltransferase MiaA [Patescibacteria group bacterium]